MLFRHIVLLLTLSLLVAPKGDIPLGTPGATPAPHPSCAQLDAYILDIYFPTYTELPEDDQELVRGYLSGEIDPRTLRPGKFRQLSRAFDTWAANLEQVNAEDIPDAARDFHDFRIFHVGLLASITNAVASGGPVAALAYDDTADELSERLSLVHEEGRAMCGDAWNIMEPWPPSLEDLENH